MTGRMKTVERGAALLDERLPGWEDRIDLEKLDLASACNCVLGQLHALPGIHRKDRYDAGLQRLHIANPRAFGFMGWTWLADYARLTTTWRDLITRRRMEKAS